MKFVSGAISIALLTCTSYVASCELATSQIFEPDATRYVSHRVGQAEANVPKPIVSSVKVFRGTTDAGSDCDDAGTVAISISIPSDSPFTINELGFQFTVKHGIQPDEIFNSSYALGAFNGDSDKTGTVYLAWLDGHPRRQKPIDIKVSVSAMSNDGRRSPEIEFDVKSGVGKPEGIFRKIGRWFSG